jgi:hypothetical protein
VREEQWEYRVVIENEFEGQAYPLTLGDCERTDRDERHSLRRIG